MALIIQTILSIIVSITGIQQTTAAEVPRIESVVIVEATLAQEIEPIVVPIFSVKDLVIKIAKEENVSVELALYVASHESEFLPGAIGDKYITCPIGPNKGKPVYARGIFQLTRCYHYNVTDAQAFDAEWNIRYAMKFLKDPITCKREFSTCRLFYK